MPLIESIQKAIREEHLDGWLFCNFAHRDKMTDALLQLDIHCVSSRRWFCIIPVSGASIKIVHTIEPDILKDIPGTTITYTTRNELNSALELFRGNRVAVLCDPFIQVLSTIDAASWELIHECGIQTESAASCIQRIRGILDEKGIESHEKAAKTLYSIVHDSWNLVKTSFSTETPIFEGDIQDFMLQRFEEELLITDHSPIVAAGKNSGNPHYTVSGIVRTEKHRGRQLKMGDVVQFDLWAKQIDGIYADISWIGFCGVEIPKKILSRFAIVTAARDLVKPAIENSFKQQIPITGSSIDALVRSYLLENCPPSSVQHRTGHGIDSDCHGSGTNLDSIEFPDNRFLLEGSCFSVEPGIYFVDSGFRTEINIYIHNGKPVVSGNEIQHTILSFQD